MLVLCGDLTNFGKTSEAEILAEDIRACSIPVSACSATTITNAASPRRSARILHEAGMTVLDEQAVEIDGVGFAGVKGFIGGFGRGELAPFGEPIVKAFVDEAMNEARKLENALAHACAPSAASPCSIIRRSATRSKASRSAIFQYLGSQRLADADRPLRPCEGGGPRPRPSRQL